MTKQGRWVIVTAEGKAGKAAYRVRLDCPRDASEYPVNVTVRYPYTGDDQGFPSAATQAELDRLEDAITPLMWPPGPSYLVLAVTGFSAREWQFQAKSYQKFMTQFNGALAGWPRLPLGIEYGDDPGWTLWHDVRDRVAAEQAQQRSGGESGAAEQGDEADEAFGGTRLVPRVPDERRRLMPAPAWNRGHRLAAYRRCSVDTRCEMKLGAASDHAGFRYKSEVAEYLRRVGHEVCDFGTGSEAPVDYPDFIRPLALARGDVERGIAVGGSGNGEAMAANRVRGVRCAVVWDPESVRLARQHNDANMLSIGERLVPEADLLGLTDVFLLTAFEGGRHRERIRKLDEA